MRAICHRREHDQCWFRTSQEDTPAEPHRYQFVRSDVQGVQLYPGWPVLREQQNWKKLNYLQAMQAVPGLYWQWSIDFHLLSTHSPEEMMKLLGQVVTNPQKLEV